MGNSKSLSYVTDYALFTRLRYKIYLTYILRMLIYINENQLNI